MAVQQRTLDTLRNDILTILKENRTNIDISPHTISYDHIDAIVRGGIFTLTNDNYIAYINLFFDDIEARVRDGLVDSEQLDSIGNLYGIPRKGASFANGFVELILGSLPSGDVFVGIGEVVGTLPQSQNEVLRYVTIEDITVFQSDLESLFSNDLSAYAVTIKVQADQGGSKYNKPIGAIQQLLTSIPNVVSVTNLNSISGGTDTEDDLTYAHRIDQIRLRPIGFSQITGIKKFLLQQSGITNVEVLRSGDPEVVRKIGFGVVDVYIRDIVTESVIDEKIFDGTIKVVLTRQPVVSVFSVSTSSRALVLGIDYNVVIDNASVFRGSPQAVSYVEFLIPLVEGDSFQIRYVINSNPGFYTDYFARPENSIQGRSLLVFQGVEVPMFFGAQVVKFPEFQTDTVISSIQQNLVDFVANQNNFGVTIQQGDLVKVVVETDGVDNIIISSIESRKLSDPVGTTEDVTVDRTSYVTLDFANIVIQITNG